MLSKLPNTQQNGWRSRTSSSRSTTHRRLHRVRASPPATTNVQEDVQGGVQEKEQDPFVAAALRLETLIHGVGDGETELLESQLREEPPSAKLGMAALAGGGVALASAAVCALCGQDPLGGASLSARSLEAAALGGLLAAPLAALRWWMWSRAASEALPALQGMHQLQAAEAEPWLSRFGKWDLAAHATLETLPTLLLLLPAAQGGLSAAFTSAAAGGFGLGGTGGGDAAAAAASAAVTAAAPAADAASAAVASGAPEGAAAALALVITAICAGVASSLNIGTDEAQVAVLRDAVQNADRFYRLTAPRSPERAATAFKAVAVAWVEAREDAAALAGAVAFLDVVAVSMIWHLTGDLTAAAVAALAVSAVDYDHLHALTQRRGGGGGGRRRPPPPDARQQRRGAE